MSPSNATKTAKAGGKNDKPGKLKDSCDMCSSSKVKCNKEKPVCGRCRKLGYPCFYSPARRIGRPHPNRRTVSWQSPETRPASLQIDTIFDDSTPPTPKDLQDPASEAEPRQNPLIRDSGGETGCGENALQWLDELYTSSSCVAERQRPLAIYSNMTSQYGSNAAFNPDRASLYPQSPLEAPELFNFPGAINNDTYWTQFMPSETAAPLFSVDPIFGQGGSAAMHTRHWDSGDQSCSQSPNSEASEPDCVTGAIEILRQLKASHSRATGVVQADPAGLDLSECMQVVSAAISRLSTITVCPCSQKTYVGTLVATVCLEILDSYDLFFNRPQDANMGEPTRKINIVGHDLQTAIDMDSQLGGDLRTLTPRQHQFGPWKSFQDSQIW
ncbi:hypothetical protein N7448_000259 [Penicillium atrosanguineum]|nr:hypothetical protein N7448_000259 [Penicillium atrosanguineum]